MNASIEYFDPEALAKPHGYRHAAATTATKLVFCAGQVSVDQDGALIGPGDHAAQAHRAMCNVITALEAAGANARSVVKFTFYVVGLGQPGVQGACYQGLGQATRERGIQPAPSTMIGVTALVRPELLIEIDAVAVVDS